VSAIAAIVAAVPSPASPSSAARMLASVPHRARFPAVTSARGSVTLAVSATFARESVFAEHPDGSAIVFDGRLDNREDLAYALSLDTTASAADVAVAACVKWGERACEGMLGDYAFAAWDASRGRMLAARDALGQRPLFYAAVPGATLVASEPRQILAHPAFARRVNEGAIAEYLTGRPCSVEETVWDGIKRLRAAHVLAVEDASTTTRRYWDFDPDHRVECVTDEDYDERFRSLLREAIACRTADSSRVGVFLSGGLDSSAIAAGAETLNREHGRPSLRAYSLTFPGLPLDETPYIDAVVTQWQLPSVLLPSRSPTRDEIEQECRRHADLPAYPNGAMLDPLRRLAVGEIDVALTGYGGDDWFTGSPAHSVDLLREGRLVAAAIQLVHDARLPGRTYTAAGLLRASVSPLLSPRVREWLRPLAGAPPLTFPWIRPDFARRTSLDQRLERPPLAPFGSMVQADIHRMLNGLSQTRGDELEDRAAAVAGLDQRHPFNDRRMAEFGFALPEVQRWSGGETKVVLRRALGSALPDLVRRRNDKAEFTPTLVQAIEGLGGAQFLSDLRVAETGWVNAAAIRQTYESMRQLYSRGDESYIRLADAVWRVAAVELWYRVIQELP
jgi:asparagine synthase (glutamine-hydrolysing)